MRIGSTTADWRNSNIGDQLFIGANVGKSVGLGEVTNIEMVNNLTTVTVKEADGSTWTNDFIKYLAANKQKLYVAALKKQMLTIDLILQRPNGHGPEAEELPPPIDPPTDHEDFIVKLNANGDDKITEQEANDFVELARRRIAEDGLTFAEFAEKIPAGLKVSGVSAVKPPNEIYYFNGVTAEVVNRGKSTLYIEIEKGFPGVRTDKYGDIDALSEVFWDVNERLERDLPPNNFFDTQQKFWPVPVYTLNVFSKEKRNMVVSDEQIESIKKVKKGNKCYHKIEFVDSGLLSPQKPPGKYNNCLISINKNDPPVI